MTDFMNFKIKSTQSFRCAHRTKLYVYIFIEISDHVPCFLTKMNEWWRKAHVLVRLVDVSHTY
jgi:hypothetical protein